MPPEPLPKGLVLFPPGTPPGRRRRRLVFLVVWLLAGVALVWPVYSFFADAFPLVLGLPLSLAWVVLWLAVVFVALVWLYRSEDG